MLSATDLTQLSDGELWQCASQGDETAFVTLYRRRQSGVYRFALRLSGSTAIAEDVTQEVFLALLHERQRAVSRYDAARSSLASYLYGIARNQVLRRFERERNLTSWPNGSCPDDDDDDFLLVDEGNPLGELTRQETIESVRQAVLALPPHYREVVVLCDLHELSYLETAAALDCAVGTVRSRLHRARALLVEKLRALQVLEKGTATVAVKHEFGVLYEMRGV